MAQALSLDFTARLGAFTLRVAFDAPMRGVTGIFGPSGSGKTTILRAVAGLEKVAGRLSLGADIWQDDGQGIYLKPHQRAVGYVFQDAGLFPHLTVRQNLVYGLRRAPAHPPEQAVAFDQAAELLGIGALLERSPRALSGGEQQRVAIGRALLSQPRLMLMDEPVSALDRMTRQDIIPYLEKLHRALDIPVLYVSHDIGEIERLADRIVLIEHGRILASGPLAEICADPRLPLMRMLGAAVVLKAEISRLDRAYGLIELAAPGGTLIVPGQQGAPGEIRRVRIAASDVSFTRERQQDTTILNILPVTIVSLAAHQPDDPQISIVAALGEDGGGARIVAHVTRKSCEALGLAPGMRIFAQVKGVALLASG